MEKDFRSLEHKIRDVMIEAMARNSAKRMQVTNVARPDTATDPTDVKSKIAKQGEIKTKIIDEEVEQIDEATDSYHVRSVDDNDNEKMHGTHSNLDSAMSAAKKIKDAEVVQTHGKANAHGYHKIKAFHSVTGKKSRPGDEDHIHPKHGLGYGGSHLGEATTKVTFDADDAENHVTAKKFMTKMKKHGATVSKTDTGNRSSVSVSHPDASVHARIKAMMKKRYDATIKSVKEDVEDIDEARKGYPKNYKSPWDKIEKASPGIGARIDSHVKALNDLNKKKEDEQKKDVKEGAVPDNWEENPAAKRKATAKKLAVSTTHDKSSKIVEAKKDDDGDMDEQDPKKLKGGKTEVDLNPKTDDRTEDENAEDKAGKKAANKANKEIGQKTKSVKEESMSKLTFGLPQSLIDVVTETLKGGQKKLDKNHNGKIDGQDFAILRGDKKGMKEEACAKCGKSPCGCTHREEVQIDEISAELKARYANKVNKKMNSKGGRRDLAAYDQSSYTGRETQAMFNRGEKLDKHRERVRKMGASEEPPRKRFIFPNREETEVSGNQIDEVSKKTLKSYISKATDGWHPDSALNLAAAAANKMNRRKGNDLEIARQQRRKAEKRGENIVKAATKLAKEEVELSAEEKARIEEIAKNI